MTFTKTDARRMACKQFANPVNSNSKNNFTKEIKSEITKEVESTTRQIKRGCLRMEKDIGKKINLDKKSMTKNVGKKSVTC